jgi:hypothetical protein
VFRFPRLCEQSQINSKLFRSKVKKNPGFIKSVKIIGKSLDSKDSPFTKLKRWFVKQLEMMNDGFS